MNPMETWISIAVIAWVAVSIVVSLVLGGAVRLADSRGATAFGRSRVRRLPPRTESPATPGTPASAAADAADALRRVS